MIIGVAGDTIEQLDRKLFGVGEAWGKVSRGEKFLMRGKMPC